MTDSQPKPTRRPPPSSTAVIAVLERALASVRAGRVTSPLQILAELAGTEKNPGPMDDPVAHGCAVLLVMDACGGNITTWWHGYERRRMEDLEKVFDDALFEAKVRYG